MSAAPPTLAINADLRLAVDGHEVRITGVNEFVVIELPSLRAGAALLKSGPFRTGRARRIAQMHRALRAAGLTAEVRVAGALFARLGLRARPGARARLLYLGNMETRQDTSSRVSLRRIFALGASLLAGLAALGWYLKRNG